MATFVCAKVGDVRRTVRKFSEDCDQRTVATWADCCRFFNHQTSLLARRGLSLK